MAQHHEFGNRLLQALSKADFDLVTSRLERIDLPVGFALEHPNTPIDHVYWMASGIASVVAIGAGEQRVEIGLIGNEGMSGGAVVLGSLMTPNETYMQVPGEGFRSTTARLVQLMAERPSLKEMFLLFHQAFLIQVSQTAVANARAKLEERLARWLLMANDRTGDHDLPLTHNFLALMLGVRRAGVTDTVSKLEERKMIRAKRAHIRILNRGALLKQAGIFYGTPEAEYRRLIG